MVQFVCLLASSTSRVGLSAPFRLHPISKWVSLDVRLVFCAKDKPILPRNSTLGSNLANYLSEPSKIGGSLEPNKSMSFLWTRFDLKQSCSEPQNKDQATRVTNWIGFVFPFTRAKFLPRLIRSKDHLHFLLPAHAEHWRRGDLSERSGAAMVPP